MSFKNKEPKYNKTIFLRIVIKNTNNMLILKYLSTSTNFHRFSTNIWFNSTL